MNVWTSLLHNFPLVCAGTGWILAQIIKIFTGAFQLRKFSISALLFGTVTSFIYSACGAILSLTVMILLKKSTLFSPVGVSVAGAVMHNVGQVLCAIIMLGAAEIGYYLVVLSVSAVLAGVLVGLASAVLIKTVKTHP